MASKKKESTEFSNIIKIEKWDVALPTGNWTGPEPLPLFPYFDIKNGLNTEEKLLEFREQHIQYHPTSEQNKLIVDWVKSNIPEDIKWLFHGLEVNFVQFQKIFYAQASIHLIQTEYIPDIRNKHLKAVYEKDWDKRLDNSRLNFIKFLIKINCNFQFVSENQALDNGMLIMKNYERPKIIGSNDIYPGIEKPPKKLWRYFTLTKFVSLLQNESIWFSRPQFFDDPHEFTMDEISQRELFQWKLDSFAREYNRAIISNRKAFVLTSKPLVGNLPINKDGTIKTRKIKLSDLTDVLMSSIRRDVQKWQESFCITCWRYSHYDSIAMWNQYASLEEGITLVVDLEKLRKSFKKFGDVRLAIVDYRDFADKSNNAMNMNPLSYKDIRYKTEEEARFYFRASLETLKGVAVPFDISDVVQEIHLSPNATGWFKNIIEGILDKYALKIPLVTSSLGKVPSKF